MPINIKRKIKRYEEISPNPHTSFIMLYYHAGRVLCRLDEQIEKELGKKPPHKIRHTLNHLQHKLEQMVARGKKQ